MCLFNSTFSCDLCVFNIKILLLTGDNKKIRDLPGAALFCLTFTHDVNNHGAAKVR